MKTLHIIAILVICFLFVMAIAFNFPQKEVKPIPVGTNLLSPVVAGQVINGEFK